MSKNDFMNTDIEIVLFGPEAQMFGPEAQVIGLSDEVSRGTNHLASMDRLTDGPAGGRADGRTGGRDGQTAGRADGRTGRTS